MSIVGSSSEVPKGFCIFISNFKIILICTIALKQKNYFLDYLFNVIKMSMSIQSQFWRILNVVCCIFWLKLLDFGLLFIKNKVWFNIRWYVFGENWVWSFTFRNICHLLWLLVKTELALDIGKKVLELKKAKLNLKTIRSQL